MGQPKNEAALSGISRIVDVFVSKAEKIPTNANIEKATEVLALAVNASPNNPYLESVGERLSIVDNSNQANCRHANSLFVQLQVQGLLQSAEIDEREGRIQSPKDNNAVEKYRKVLDLDPNNNKATERLKQLGSL